MARIRRGVSYPNCVSNRQLAYDEVNILDRLAESRPAWSKNLDIDEL
jgi:hypothetical protein